MMQPSESNCRCSAGRVQRYETPARQVPLAAVEPPQSRRRATIEQPWSNHRATAQAQEQPESHQSRPE
eukprot:3173387-Lingulodinium_polyedra.AAC.1